MVKVNRPLDQKEAPAIALEQKEVSIIALVQKEAPAISKEQKEAPTKEHKEAPEPLRIPCSFCPSLQYCHSDHFLHMRHHVPASMLQAAGVQEGQGWCPHCPGAD